MKKSNFRVLTIALALTLSGCATTSPYVGQGPHPQISRGHPNPLVDGIGIILGLPVKLLLWDMRVESHTISEETEQVLINYLGKYSDSEALTDTHFRLNEYNPINDLGRLVDNKHVAWPFRLILGLPLTLIYEVLLPGRLMSLLVGDHFNPYTNTVHIYSDHPAIVLHEAGHAHNFSEQTYKGVGAFLYQLSAFGLPVDLYEEFLASERTVEHFIAEQDRDAELQAYKILYPAYGSYLGGHFIPWGNFPGAFVGHIWGRGKARQRANYYNLVDR